MTEPASLSQAEFARRRGVSKKTVTKWKADGLLVMTEDGRVDVEKSEWSLDQRPAQYRGGTTHRPIRAVPKDEPDPRERRAAPKPKIPPAAAERPGDADDPETEPEDDPDGENLPTPAAIRRKENFLGLQRKQQFQVKQGELVDRAAAEKLFFDTARENRDAWTGWPTRVAIPMAERLKVDPRTLTMVLTEHVKQHLAELGEPEVELPGPP